MSKLAMDPKATQPQPTKTPPLRSYAEQTEKAASMKRQRDTLIVFLIMAVVIIGALAVRAAKGDVTQNLSEGRTDARERGPYGLRPAPPRPAQTSDGPYGDGSPSARPQGRRAVVTTITRQMRVTAYCPCEKCCGQYADGITASGLPVTHNGGRFVAAPSSIPFGTLIKVPGYAAGSPVPVVDRGGAITNDRLDVFFPTHSEALAWGSRDLEVTIAAEAQTMPAGRQGEQR